MNSDGLSFWYLLIHFNFNMTKQTLLGVLRIKLYRNIQKGVRNAQNNKVYSHEKIDKYLHRL